MYTQQYNQPSATTYHDQLVPAAWCGPCSNSIVSSIVCVTATTQKKHHRIGRKATMPSNLCQRCVLKPTRVALNTMPASDAR